MSDISVIVARLSLLEYKLSEVLARLQKCESTQPFKIEAGKFFIEEAPIKNAAIGVASDACIAANREAIIENAIENQAMTSTNEVSITLRKHDGAIALRLKPFF